MHGKLLILENSTISTFDVCTQIPDPFGLIPFSNSVISVLPQAVVAKVKACEIYRGFLEWKGSIAFRI